METIQELETVELRGKNVSKAIRDLLKKKFPTTKFSVKYESFAGGDSVRIAYLFGPTSKEVEKLVKSYQEGSFNGMEDLYEYHNDRVINTVDGKKKIKGGVKYVQITRDYPEGFVMQFATQITQLVERYYPGFIPTEDYPVVARRILWKVSFTSDKISNVVPVDLKPLGFLKAEEMFGVEYTCEYAQKKEEAKKNKADLPKNLELVDYSEYSIAVFGPAWNCSKELKEAGGRYNKFLTHPETKKQMPGWIFRKNQREQVRNILRLP